MRVAQMGPICVPHNSPIKKKRNYINIFIKLISSFIMYDKLPSTVADTEGIHVVRSNPHLLRKTYFIFMRNFQKNQHKISNYQVQFSNQTPPPPFVNLNPLARNPRSAPVSTIYFIYMGQPIWNPVALPIWVPI